MSPSAKPRVNNCTPLHTHTHTLYLDPPPQAYFQYLLSPFSNSIPPFSESNSKKTKTLHPHEVLDKHSSFPVFLFCFLYVSSCLSLRGFVMFFFFFQTLLSIHLSRLPVPKKIPAGTKGQQFFPLVTDGKSQKVER